MTNDKPEMFCDKQTHNTKKKNSSKIRQIILKNPVAQKITTHGKTVKGIWSHEAAAVVPDERRQTKKKVRPIKMI